MVNSGSQRIKGLKRPQTFRERKAALPRSSTGKHQNIVFDPRPGAGLQIGQGIANHDGSREINRQVGRGLNKQPRLRFAARTMLVWGMRAKVDRIHATPHLLDYLKDPAINFVGLIARDYSAPNRRLVRQDHNDAVAGLKFRQRLQRAGKERYILPTAHIIITIFDDNTISV